MSNTDHATAQRTEAHAIATAEQCGGITMRSFARCTKRAAYLVADEYFGETFKLGRLARSARVVEFWGACRLHRESHRGDSSPYGSALSAWNHLELDGSGCFNGRRLGWVELERV